ncbi:MAG: DUF1801 domain-containing protein [Bacteroidota bacterium]
MSTSSDQKVQAFLDNLQIVDSPKYQIILAARAILFEQYPDAKERMMYGGILFSLEEDFAGLFAYTHHVSMEFGNGYLMNDPEKLLEGKGKYRRHLKITSMDQQTMGKLAFFVPQAYQKP